MPIIQLMLPACERPAIPRLVQELRERRAVQHDLPGVTTRVDAIHRRLVRQPCRARRLPRRERRDPVRLVLTVILRRRVVLVLRLLRGTAPFVTTIANAVAREYERADDTWRTNRAYLA